MKRTRTRKDDRMEEGNWLKIGTPRTVLFLRGRGCNIPPAYLGYFLYFEYIVLTSVNELKAKAPPEAKPCSLYELLTSVKSLGSIKTLT